MSPAAQVRWEDDGTVTRGGAVIGRWKPEGWKPGDSLRWPVPPEAKAKDPPVGGPWAILVTPTKAAKLGPRLQRYSDGRLAVFGDWGAAKKWADDCSLPPATWKYEVVEALKEEESTWRMEPEENIKR